MLFRPEEVHLRSSRGGGNTGVGEVGVSDDGRDVGMQNFTVPHLDRDPLITIEARAVNSHYAAWK